ncbi:MAG: serine/threonine protein kinase [Candidatus Riflebacteria bacterium]|nr:serine/threonine protein kinase [Candidatus Riflebacteria bacterium]
MTARPGPHDLASGTIVGGYRVNRLLGVGGMGVVYRATQLSLQRDVALKVLASRLAADDDSRLRFLQEGQLAARVSHPHLVHVLDVGESHQGMFIAFELVEGETLKQRIDREGALVAPFAIEVVVTCADVLSTLHESGILHRDLKPANIFIPTSSSRRTAAPSSLIWASPGTSWAPRSRRRRGCSSGRPATWLRS